MKKLSKGPIAAIIFALAILMVMPVVSLAQGRGRGNDRGRGRDMSWKCGKFVNCHDARDGRVGVTNRYRRVGTWRNGIFVSRGERVGYRNRYNTNDYWRRRHLVYRRDLNTNGRYRRWRNRY